MADALAAEPGWPALSAQAPVTPHTADDADATRLKIGRVPTWLLVNAQGEELGRIAGAQPAAAAIAEWRGSIFIKGSRRYQLEKVLASQPAHSLPC